MQDFIETKMGNATVFVSGRQITFIQEVSTERCAIHFSKDHVITVTMPVNEVLAKLGASWN